MKKQRRISAQADADISAVAKEAHRYLNIAPEVAREVAKFMVNRSKAGVPAELWRVELALSLLIGVVVLAGAEPPNPVVRQRLVQPENLDPEVQKSFDIIHDRIRPELLAGA